MFKALMGGGNRSSSDVASASSSKSGSRRKDSRSSTTSRKSSRGDDRERGLGDLAAYSSSGSRKYGAGEADPSVTIDSDRMIIERTPKRKSGDGDRRDSDRDRDNKSARRRDRERSSRDLGSRSKGKERSVDDPGDDFDRSSRRERRRTQPGDPYPPPLNTNIPTSGAGEQFAADINAPGFSQFPGMQYDSMVPGATMPDHSGSPAAFDPHVHQQFPGQFPDTVAEPYRPPNPAGEAAEYYGDQGQSVSEQPGVRPNLPAVIPNSQAHLLPASPVVNPPPEPSSVGQVGAAAAYYADDDLQSQPSQQSGRPPRPSKPNQSSHGLGSATVAGAAAYGVGSALHSHSNSGSRPPSYPGSPAEPSNMAQPPMSGIDRPPHSHSIGPGPGIAAAGAAAYGVGNTLHGHSDSGSRPPSYPQSPAEPSHMAYAQPPMSGPGKPSHSHSMGPGVGLAAAGAAAGYMMGHHHHSSSSPEHPAQYTMQDYEHPSHGATPIYGPNINPALFGAGAAGAAGYGAAHGMHTHGQGPAFPSGGLAFQQRRRGPLDRLVDFWRDPEGVGMFEDYTETIGVCRYCFDPGTTSRDAPRKHHYHRRRSWDRHSNGSRVEKLSRFTSSEDESRRRRKSKKKSWLPALLAGYAAKSIFTNKDFDDTYSVKSGRVVTPKGSFRDNESVSTLDRKSQTSHGVCRRSGHSPSRGSSYSDLKRGRYEGYHKRSRSRSRSSSRSNRHSALRNAALGAAVGGVAYAATKSHRSHSSSKGKSRKGSSSSSSTSVSSHSDSSLPSRKSVAGGLASFFTAPTKNRTKRGNRKPKGIFSVNNSSSSSLDADLAFGTGVKKPRSGKSGRKGRDEKDLDAKLLGLGATATALAASSHRHNRRTGEILANKDARSRRLDYASSATNDDGWEDLDPGDQSASSVSSGLAFGSGDDSQTSDSGTSKWGWRWGGKKDKKKKRSSSSEHHFPSGAAVAAGLGGAALATAYHSHSKHPSQDNVSESAGSLQHVFPAPTSDPSQFDAVRVPSSSQPTLVRPGPIPLQQPQPVTPVSNAIYTTQGEPTYFTAPSEPPAIGNASSGYYAQYEDSRSGYINQRDLDNSTHSSSSKVRRPHRRSDSSPVFGTESLEGVPTPSLKRRSTTKDQPTVQFDLTEEQARRERRASRRDGDRRDDQFEGGPQLIDREHELALEDADHEKRRRRGREDEARGRDDDYDQAYSRSSRSRRDREGLERRQESGDSSWVGPAVAGTIGAAAAASALSSRSSHNDPSETSQRRHSVRREKRRAERRRGDSRSEMSTISEDVYQPEESSPMGESDKTVRESPSRDSNGRPAHDDYVEFFAPAEVRRSPDKHTQDRDASMPRIVEVEPANERFAREISQLSTGSRNKDSSLPWPVPTLNLIEPTPPQSLNGSVRDTTSPTRFSEERPVEVKPSEQQRSASRVSWGEHQTHEYEVPSSSSERDSADQEGARELDRTRDAAQEEKPRNHGIGTDVEFAATVAAATAAAGFDPSLVTDDPTYHTRSTGPDTKEPIDLSRPEPRGFVEGEVETSDSDSKNKEPSSRNQDNAREAEPEPSAEHLIEGDPIYSEPESLTKGSKGVVQEAEERPSFDGDDSFNMPGGFEFDDSPTESRRERDYHDTSKSDSRSVVSAPVAGDFAALSRSQKSRPSDGDYDEIGDISREPDEDGTEGKKRRKRRSKRDSGSIDDAASVTSSPAKIEATKEKRRSQDGKDKGKSSSGFFSNLFGSRVSEPAEPKRSSSIDGHSSREVKSEIGTGMREEPRRHKRRSSRHRSMDDLGLLEGQGPDQDSKLGDKDDVNLENYKSHRQRREERRRHRHEEIAESGKATDYEKDRQDDNDDRQSFLGRSPEMPEKVGDDDEDGASGLASVAAAGAAGWGLDMAEGHLRSRSTSPSPKEMDQDQEEQDEGQKSRRSSMLRMSESPTAVPLHFRRPPTSPGANRAPSVSSPAAPSPDTPTQPRHRRPTSTEFKNSREIRPLFLVERHGAAKMEAEPDEPLPSLPSSKTSSRTPSLEDLKASDDQDVREWEKVDLSQHVHGGRRPDLRISTGGGDFTDEQDILGSQQATPTAETFDRTTQPAKKDKPTYEFHSPSELLQDPSKYEELPPSPTLEALPSAEGSVVGTADENAEKGQPRGNNESLGQESPNTVVEAAPTQEKDSFATAVDVAKGIGFAGVVDAAVHAAVSEGNNEGSREVPVDGNRTEFKDIAPELMTREIAGTAPETDAASDLVVHKSELPRPSSPSQHTGAGGFADVVDAAVAAAAMPGADKEAKPADTEQFEVPEDAAKENRDVQELPAEDSQPSPEAMDGTPDETPQSQYEEAATEFAPVSSSKKKKNKKKKSQSADLIEPEPAASSSVTENEKPMEPEPEPVLAEPEAGQIRSPAEPSRELEPEPVQPEETEEAFSTPVSSKKAKRDKKKKEKRKSKGLEVAEEPEPVGKQETVAPTEHREEDDTEAVTPGEDVSRQPEKNNDAAPDDSPQDAGEIAGIATEITKISEQPPFEGTKEPDVESEQKRDLAKSQESIRDAEDPNAASGPIQDQGTLEPSPETANAESEPAPLGPEEATMQESAIPAKDSVSPEAAPEAITQKETQSVDPEPTEKNNTELEAAIESGPSRLASEERAAEETPAPIEHSIPETAEPAAQNQEMRAVETEPEPALSRKASKKSKKKNKKKSVAEEPAEGEPTETKQSPTDDAAIESQPEHATAAETPAENVQSESQPEEVGNLQDTQQQHEQSPEPPAEREPDSAPADTSSGIPEQAQEVNPLGEWEEQPKKKGKKAKKNRKAAEAAALLEAQAEPEPESKREMPDLVGPTENQPRVSTTEAVVANEGSVPEEEKPNEETPATEDVSALTEVEKEPEKQPEDDKAAQPEQPASEDPSTDLGSKEMPAEGEAPKDDMVESQDSPAPEPEIPLTAAQKKKAKKDKKKKRQSASLEISGPEHTEGSSQPETHTEDAGKSEQPVSVQESDKVDRTITEDLATSPPEPVEEPSNDFATSDENALARDLSTTAEEPQREESTDIAAPATETADAHEEREMEKTPTQKGLGDKAAESVEVTGAALAAGALGMEIAGRDSKDDASPEEQTPATDENQAPQSQQGNLSGEAATGAIDQTHDGTGAEQAENRDPTLDPESSSQEQTQEQQEEAQPAESKKSKKDKKKKKKRQSQDLGDEQASPVNNEGAEPLESPVGTEAYEKTELPAEEPEAEPEPAKEDTPAVETPTEPPVEPMEEFQSASSSKKKAKKDKKKRQSLGLADEQASPVKDGGAEPLEALSGTEADEKRELPEQEPEPEPANEDTPAVETPTGPPAEPMEEFQSASSKKKAKKDKKKRQSLGLADEQTSLEKDETIGPAEVAAGNEGDKQEEPTVQEPEPTHEDTPAEASTEAPSEPVEEFQSSTSKKKAKRDKKKRKSLGLDEEQPSPVKEDESPKDAEAAEPLEVVTGTETGKQEEYATRESEPVQEDFSAEPPTETPTSEPVEEFQFATSKKKAKKDKKKRQSLSLDDEQPSPIKEDEPLKEAETAEPLEDPTGTKTDKQEEPATRESDTVQDVSAEPSTEAPVSEPVEEFQSVTSKKKTKKDKKKRKSVSFDIDELPAKPSESTEAAPQADEAKPEEDISAQIESPSASTEDAGSAEPGTEKGHPSVETHMEDSSAAVDEQGESTQAGESTPREDNAIDAPSEAISEAGLDTSMSTAMRENESQQTTGENTDVEGTAGEPEKTEATEAIPEDMSQGRSEEPPTAESQSPQLDDDAEQESSSKSKTDKKKKKKRKTLELNEEILATPEPITEPQEETDKPTDQTTPDVKEAEEPAIPDQEEEMKPFMSAKEKRKAKKEKKRQSKNVDVDDSQNAPATSGEEPKDLPESTEKDPAEDPSQEMATLSTEAEPSEPPLAGTAPPPAEEDGKENQSHDAQTSDENEKHRTWTDEMVSSQVEQQQEATPLQTASEQAEPDPALFSSGEPDVSGRDITMEEGPSTSGPLESADIEKTPGNEPSTTANEGTEPQPMEEVEEESKQEPMERAAEETTIAEIPGESVESNDSTAPEGADIPKPEELEGEDWSMTTSSKKKKKQKKKEKQREKLATEFSVGESVTAPKEHGVDDDQKNDEPSAEVVEPETSKEHSLEPEQKNDESAMEITEPEAPRELGGGPEEPSLEFGQTSNEPSARPPEPEQPKEELLESSMDASPIAEEIETSGLSRKMSKKEKKKKRRAQELASQAQEQSAAEEDTQPPAATEGAEGPVPSENQEDKPPIADAGASQNLSSDEQAVDIGNDLGELAEPVVSTEDRKDVEASGPQAFDGSDAHEEPTEAEGPADVGQFPTDTADTLAGEATREIPEELEDSWFTTSKKKSKKDKKKALAEAAATEQSHHAEVPPASEPIGDAGETAEQPTTDVQPTEEKKEDDGEDEWAMPTKKKGKKAKKEKQKQKAREEQAELSTPVESQPESAADIGSTGANEPPAPTEDVPLSEEQHGEDEQDQSKGPFVSLDPFEVSPAEGMDADMPVEPTGEGEARESPVEGSKNDATPQEHEEQIQAKLQRQALEKEDDLEVAEDLFGDRSKKEEGVLPVSRKLSKKEKRKAKQKKGTIESAEQPEQEQEPEVFKDIEVPPQATEDPAPAIEEPKDEPVLSRSPSKKKKKARQMELGQQDEGAWPSIEWEKNPELSTKQAPESSHELQQVVSESNKETIGEFDEAAIPWAVAKEPEEPAVEDTWLTPSKKKDKKKRKSKQESVDEGSAQPLETELAREPPAKQSKIANIFPDLERGAFRRTGSKTSLRSGEDNAEDETMKDANRDNAIQVSEAPLAAVEQPDSAEQQSMPTMPDPFTAQTTTRELQAPEHAPSTVGDDKSPRGLRRSPSVHGKHHHTQRPWSLEGVPPQPTVQSLFGGPVGDTEGVSPPRTPLDTISEQEPVENAGEGTMERNSRAPQLEVRSEHLLPRPQTPVRKFTDNALDRQRWPTPDKDLQDETGGEDELGGIKKRRTDERPRSRGEKELPPTPTLKPSPSERSLRRTTRSVSGDLRSTSRAQGTTTATSPPQPPLPPPLPSDLNLEQLPSSSSYDPLTDKGKRPVRGMTDVYEGWGETPTSPRSPNRPPSVRHRRSMQHLQDLESRLDQLIAENRNLVAEREAAEDKLKKSSVARRKSDHALNTRGADLRDKEAEVEQLRSSVEWFQKEVSRLTYENEGLTATSAGLTAAHAQELVGARETSTRELDHWRSQYDELSAGMEDRVRQEVDAAVANKNAEIRRLHEELETTRDRVKELQQQIATSMQDDTLVFRDEDYFDGACQRLCGHAQQWVLRFSKHSDHHRCRKLSDLSDEKIADRFDNAILDGYDADAYLSDRVRRRDVFMSVVMTMIWEYIFTRYLFGMDRDQRQKLKSLEKHLSEVGPRSAVHRWRATTLTLLSKRAAFSRQRESDTEAVALEIFGTLSRLLPPPAHVESQLLESLRKVLRVAVNLSIEMRSQLAEYIMLPPLQPEYDTNGDLARHVYFNASLMNERSGDTTSNEELETQQSVVRIVLFPLVVKKGNDTGEGEDEIVVCPAQVLVARPGKDKHLSLNANRSVHSIAPPSTMDMGNVI